MNSRTDPLLLDRHDKVALVTLNRPELGNAFNDTLVVVGCGPCPLIIKLFKAGRHGRKTGRGICEYDDQGVKIPNSGVRPF